MKRPSESDYTSLVAYTRALEAYCDAKNFVGLTDEEIKRIGKLDWDSDYVGLWYDFAKAIEAAIRSKNT